MNNGQEAVGHMTLYTRERRQDHDHTVGKSHDLPPTVDQAAPKGEIREGTPQPRTHARKK